MSVTVLIVPGVNNSGPDHWQSLWQARLPRALRAEQENWEWPDCEEASVSEYFGRIVKRQLLQPRARGRICAPLGKPIH